MGESERRIGGMDKVRHPKMQMQHSHSESRNPRWPRKKSEERGEEDRGGRWGEALEDSAFKLGGREGAESME